MTNTSSIAWLGLDAHSQNCLLAQLDDHGIERKWWRFRTQPDALIQHVQAIPATDKRLMLEETNLTRWIAQLLRPHVQQLVVCDARHNRLISSHPNKHDRRDAFALARLLRLNEYKPVWQPTDDSRVLFKRAAQTYDDAVRRQTRLKLQIKSLFQHWGFFPTGASVFSTADRPRWLQQLPHDLLRSQTRLLYQSLDQALLDQHQARRLLLQAGRPFPEIGHLQTVPGVGVIGAHLFVAFVVDPSRFKEFSKLTRFCRLAIRDQSSDGKPLGFEQLDRQGHSLLKAISYRAYLQAAKRKQGPVWNFYQASLRRVGSTTHARLNTQRKIIKVMWTLWQQQTKFDPKEFSHAQT
jgi:transposase